MRPHFSTLFLLQLISVSLFCADTLQFDQPILSQYDINQSVKYYIDSTGLLLSNDVRKRKGFQDVDLLHLDSNPESIRYNYWFRFTMKNGSSSDSSRYVLHCGVFDTLELHIYEEQKQIDKKLFGFLTEQNAASHIDQTRSTRGYYLPLVLAPEQSLEFLVRMRNTISFPDTRMAFSLEHPDFEIFRKKVWQQPFYIFSIGFASILMFIFLLSIYQYLGNLDRTHLYYAAYLFCLLLFFWYRLEKSGLLPHFFSAVPEYYYAFELPLGAIIYLFYLIFISHFLQEKRSHFALLFRWKNLLVLLLALYIFVVLLMIPFIDGYDLWRWYFQSRYLRLAMAACVIGYIVISLVRVLRLRLVYLNLFLVGTILLVFLGGGVQIILYGLVPERFLGPWEIPLLALQAGILLEVFFYSLALFYRDRFLQSENLQIKLNNLVNLLSPHFVGNALNNLEDLIHVSKEQATSYLYVLSDLFKEIITHAQERRISLSSELEILEHYLQVQQTRFPERFDYKIYIASNIDSGDYFIPPFILQPHVENAVKYAFNKTHFKGKGCIDIQVDRNNTGHIVCSIEDNGIGRKLTATQQGGTGSGQRLTEEIIGNFNRIFRTGLSLHIIDKYDPSTSRPLGTRVELVIPPVS